MNTREAAQTVRLLNEFLQTELWFDFEIWKYEGYRLTIAGGIDPTESPDLEIFFDNVFFLNCPTEWKSDTSVPPVRLLAGAEAESLNKLYQVERGHHLFSFAADGIDDAFRCLVAAKAIGFRVAKADVT